MTSHRATEAQRKKSTRRFSVSLCLCGTCILLAAVVGFGQARAQPKPLPKGSFAQNFEYVGFTDLSGHLPFKIDIQQVNGRWYMYAGSQNDRGWSVLDVTDPASPKV